MGNIKAVKRKRVKYEKASKNEYEKRLDEIIEVIVSGKSTTATVTFISGKYKIDERQAFNLLKDARLKMTSLTETNLYYHYAKSLKVKEKLFENAMDAKDYKFAFDIQKDVDDKTGVTRNAMFIMASLEFPKMFIELFAKKFAEINKIPDETERYNRGMEAMQEVFEESFDRSTPEFKQLPENTNVGYSELDEKTLDCVL